jgi:phenylacetate-CoA ligase
MSPYRKDNLGELIQFVRSRSPFYQKTLEDVPANAASVTELPIMNPDEYWKANARTPNGVLTGPLIDATAMRSGGSTGTPKQVYMTRFELMTHGKVTANAMAQGCGILPGDRVANMSYHGSLYGSFMLLNTALLELPIPIVHLPISGNESMDMMVQYMEIHDATVLIANVSTTRRIAEYLKALGKTMPRLRLILYTGECFTKELRPVYRDAFPNSIIYVRGYGGIDFGHVGIPAQPFKHEDDDLNPVYKVMAPLIIIEIIDENGNPITESGVKGSVVVTNLLKRLQPLLRYPVGDVASWVDYDAETFRIHGRSAVGLKISSSHLPLSYLRDLIVRVLGEGKFSGSQFVAKRVIGTHQQAVVFRIVAPEPQNADELMKAFEQKLSKESPTWEKNRQLGNIAPLQIEWIEGKDLVTNNGSGKLRDIVDERY